MDIADIVRMLAARAPELARELLPGGRRDGHEWRAGSLAGESGQSLGVRLTGPRAGVWADFASGETGDALDLVAATLFAGDKRDALTWSRRWLGIDSADPRALQQRRQELQVHAERADVEAEAERARKQRHAKAMWLSAEPAIAGTPVDWYLRERAIPLSCMPRLPRALRFDPRCWNAEVRAELPAMLAAITNRAGDHVATHRTWLARRADSNTWGKAPLRKAKMVLGPMAGGLIPLSRGGSGTALKAAGGGETIAITEGVEDGLTVALECPEWRVVAAVSLGNMAALQLPETLLDVVLVFDRDGENEQARTARDRAVRRYQREDRRVRIVQPPEGHKDMNAWAMAIARQQAGVA